MADIVQDEYQFTVNTALVAQWKDTLPQPTTRKIYRHESNQGSVIEIDYWGTPMKLFVADAKYRGLSLAYDTTPQLHGNPLLSVKRDYFNGTFDNDTVALSYNKNDTWIQSTYAALKDDGTAKSNTDALMAYSTTQAAHHCRNQNISGVGQLDLPNLYESIIMYLESDNIDALDPTAQSNKDKALGKMNTYGRFDFSNSDTISSSTESSNQHARCVSHNGSVSGIYQWRAVGVAPVKEL